MPQFQPAASYTLPPGVCYLCKASQTPGQRIIDCSVDVDFEGRLYICEPCVREMAAMLAASTLTPDREELEALQLIHDEMAPKVLALQKVAKILADAGYAKVVAEIEPAPDPEPETVSTVFGVFSRLDDGDQFEVMRQFYIRYRDYLVLTEPPSVPDVLPPTEIEPAPEPTEPKKQSKKPKKQSKKATKNETTNDSPTPKETPALTVLSSETNATSSGSDTTVLTETTLTSKTSNAGAETTVAPTIETTKEAPPA